MISAIFIVPVVDGQPQIDTETIMTDSPLEGYGHSLIGQVPSDNACLVRIWSSDEALDTLAETYIFVEDVANGEGD